VLGSDVSNAIAMLVLGLCFAAVLWLMWWDRHRDD
jgi:cbb3-type cytochrome oxidase subunit 3